VQTHEKRELSGKRGTRRLRASSQLCYCVHLGTTGRFGLVVREERGCGQAMGHTVTELLRGKGLFGLSGLLGLCGCVVRLCHSGLARLAVAGR
jgi:hypothetical protein